VTTFGSPARASAPGPRVTDLRDSLALVWCRPCLVVLLVLGCGPAVTTDDTSTDTGGSADSTATTAGTTATTAPGTTTTTTTGTTGAPTCPADFVSGCQSYCAAEITCNPDLGPYEDCVNELCAADVAAASAECQQSFCEALTCYGGLDCATLQDGSPE